MNNKPLKKYKKMKRFFEKISKKEKKLKSPDLTIAQAVSSFVACKTGIIEV